jgi:hypothetical protein
VAFRVLLAAIFAVPAARALEPGVVTGHVVDARTGAGIVKVLVLVDDGGPSTQTDIGGAFRIPTVATGIRRLYVSVVGYILVRREVLVPAAGTVDVTISLSEGTGTYTETVIVAADRFPSCRAGRRGPNKCCSIPAPGGIARAAAGPCRSERDERVGCWRRTHRQREARIVADQRASALPAAARRAPIR